MYLILGHQAGFGRTQYFKTDDERKYYYPTNTLVTGPDIIFFWVARMIMAGMHFQKRYSFQRCLLYKHHS